MWLPNALESYLSSASSSPQRGWGALVLQIRRGWSCQPHAQFSWAWARGKQSQVLEESLFQELSLSLNLQAPRGAVMEALHLLAHATVTWGVSLPFRSKHYIVQ